LVADDERVSDHPLAAGFREIRRVTVPVADAAADAIEDTGLFQLTAAAGEAIAGAGQGSLVWIHARGMDGPWDAPLEMRNHFADADDPPPPKFARPPQQLLPEGFDPDELLGFTHAYAGQVALADECLGLLLAALDEQSERDETLLIVTSPRGYPLGEHRRVGPVDEALYAELLQVPLLVRFPGGSGGLARSQHLIQPQSLFATIIGAPAGRDLSRLISGERLDCADCAVSTGIGQRAIRTPAWFLRQFEDDSGARHELFAKPDDRFEINEIASRCGEAVELLAARLNEFEAAARADRLAELPPLAELLADVWR
jgi:arylsulfatase A-like enzyme